MYLFQIKELENCTGCPRIYDTISNSNELNKVWQKLVKL